MHKKPVTILGINPGTRYVAVALFRNAELRDWFMKVFKGKWSEKKMKKILTAVTYLLSHYGVTALAVKKLHPSRTSRRLDSLVASVKSLAKQKHLKVREYTIDQMEQSFNMNGRANKKKMVEQVMSEYPVLFNEFEKEKCRKNPYYTRLFEAVALGSVCYDALDRTRSHDNL
jgi:Holliday junction resolvasome RuvABC endonuclease subunit